ncbi:bifunctional diguanylate cyclase/phosphodiesterase [Agaribacter flavus]|uniref:EAL domain-containing protein n=1 Tax=Agaribacter flavus TaxID=1902781 RepID=A0ABV7FTN3_9ALTE
MSLAQIKRLSLNAQITLLSVCLVVITAGILMSAYWLQTANYSQNQIERRLQSAENVINQYLFAKASILETASRVLTADFGFKQAVATKDSATIQSVLFNHGQRIEADLMVLVDTEGHVLSTSSVVDLPIESLQHAVQALSFDLQSTQILVIDEKVYQLILLPVKAPRTIAYSLIGFKIDSLALQELKRLNDIDVTLVADEQVLYSSLPSISQASQNVNSPQLDDKGFWRQNNFANTAIQFAKDDSVYAVLSASLEAEKKEFEQLIRSMLLMGSAIVLVSVVLSRLLSLRITTPLSKLIDITKKISRGNFSIQEKAQSSSLEFSELNKAFFRMGEAIQQREGEIKYQAEHDALTGLFNRSMLLSNIDRALEQEKDFLIVGVNIRQFAQVNDTMGPQAGDECLRFVAQRLQQYLTRFSDSEFAYAARIAADDFLISIPIVSESEVSYIVHDLNGTLSRPYTLNDLTINLNFRLGVTSTLACTCNAETLLRRVAIAANFAKTEQSRIRYYVHGEDEAYLARLQMLEELKDAINNDDGELFFNYQPKLDLSENKVNKAEALIRWINKNGEFVNPEVFIGLAEQSGLIVTLTRWVITKVIEQLADWQTQGHIINVSINLSAQDIQHPDFVDFLLQQIALFKVSASQITLELTERDLVENEELVVERLTYLKSLDFDVSVDDYGIGQSSLSKLKRLPIDELKIDKSFIMKLDQSETDQDIVSSTIALGHKLGLRVVAEGVENKESLQLLREFDCNLVQGYFVSRPLKAKEFIDWYLSYEIPLVSEYKMD